jgi:hypothetical protein
VTISKPAPRTALTFEEEITAAFMHYVRGVSQQDIAIMMGGVNGGRVNEACLAVKGALTPPRSSKAVTMMDIIRRGEENASKRGEEGMITARGNDG